MKTNRFFNFKRFYNLLSYDLRINGKRYLSFLVGGIVIFYLILLINMNGTYDFSKRDYPPLFLLCLLGLGIFMGSAFPELSNKIKTSNYLLLPASTLEKIASQFLIYIVFGSFFFLLIFWVDTYLAKWTVMQIKSTQQQSIIIDNFQYIGFFEDIGLSYFWDKLLLVMFVVFVCLFLFATRLFFKRFALVKSVITLLVVIFSFVCYMSLFSRIFYPETKWFNLHLPEYDLISGFSNVKFGFCILIYPLWMFFLPLAYHKLKEKQS